MLIKQNINLILIVEKIKILESDTVQQLLTVKS